MLNQQLIVNADDFGHSVAINRAILDSIQRLEVSNASLMVNLAGFDDAVESIKSGRIHSTRLGLHINLTEGVSLTHAIRSCPAFCDASGHFIYGRDKAMFVLSSVEKAAVLEEIEAQVRKFRLTGAFPAHIDSHHHIHTEPAIILLVIQIARKYNIPRIRIARNTGTSQNLLKKAYRLLLNTYLRYGSGLKVTDYFGNMEDLSGKSRATIARGKLVEIMIHPMINHRQELVDSDNKSLKLKMEHLLGRRMAAFPADLTV